jgi:hypothetical protein
MVHIDQHPLNFSSWIASLLNRIMAECEGFGARYQYSPRLMIAGAILTSIQTNYKIGSVRHK